jgi:hypothetical protein
LAGEPKYSEKTCHSATLSATNPTLFELASNPGCRGGKPTTNHLSYGMAFSFISEHALERHIVINFISSKINHLEQVFKHQL